MRVNAVVLAARANTGRLKDTAPAEWEALIDVAGKPMLQYVVDALEGAESIGDIVVVGPAALGAVIRSGRIRIVPPEGDMVQNVMAGFAALPGNGKALVATCDVPMITPAVVDGFIDECGDLSADFYYPVVRQNAVESKYPGVKRTYAILKEGPFTGGNMFIVELGVADRLRKTLEFLVENRKKPVRMARVFGLPFVLKMMLKRLTIDEAETKAGALYGIVARAVITRFPEIGFDVDKPSDFSLAVKVLSTR